METHASEGSPARLSPYLTTCGAISLAFGCAVGWGAFIMPGTAFLPVAGPLGTLIGLAVGAAVMFLVGRNYHCMIQKFPEAGGAYGYVKAIRADARLAKTPVHVITTDVELQETYTEKGFDSIILKPVTIGTLGPLLAGLAERKG